METTIHRGMEIQAYQPVQLLLDFMMEEVKDEFYSKFIMLDLQEIIACERLKVNKFLCNLSRDD
jgi:hypothetical protein